MERLDGQTVVHLGRVPAIAARAGLLTCEITIVPSLLLYAFVEAGHAMVGLLVVLVWRTACVAGRLTLGLAVPATVWVSFGLFSARTAGGLAVSSVSLYLVVPVAVSALQGAVFLGSAFTRRPLIGRLLGDFASDIPDHPALRRLFAQLTGWWGVVHLVGAGVGGWAVTLAAPQAVAITSVLGLVCTAASLGGCALWGLWRAARIPGLRVRFEECAPEPLPAVA